MPTVEPYWLGAFALADLLWAIALLRRLDPTRFESISVTYRLGIPIG
ncbi:hypothetical protein [Oculatella sp. LEGE 06141]